MLIEPFIALINLIALINIKICLAPDSLAPI